MFVTEQIEILAGGSVRMSSAVKPGLHAALLEPVLYSFGADDLNRRSSWPGIGLVQYTGRSLGQEQSLG